METDNDKGQERLMDISSETLASIEKRLDVARIVARDAGRLLMDYHGNLDSVDKKGRVDLVTQADKESEELVFDRF